MILGRLRPHSSSSPKTRRVTPSDTYDRVMTTTAEVPTTLRFLSLEITARCQLTCPSHCYAQAGPTCGHGSFPVKFMCSG